MNIKTHIVKKTAAVFCVLMSATTYVHSAVTITFAQSGPDVTLTSSGTFNPAVCTTRGSASGGSNRVTPSQGFVNFNDGTGAYSTCNGAVLTPPSSGVGFGTGSFSTGTSHTGVNFYFAPLLGWFWGPSGYTSTSSFAGSLTFNSTSLSAMSLTPGSYVYTFTNQTTPSIQDTVTVVVPGMNSAPSATSVSIAGTAQVGSTLTGSYNYTDADSDAQGTSIFLWVKNNVNTGVTGGSPVGTTTTYTPTANDVGSYLYYCVTPVAAAGVTTGTEVCSVATSAVTAAPAPTAIPTLSEWAMIFLASLMAMVALVRTRRQ